MKNLPTPTFPLSQSFLLKSATFLGLARIDRDAHAPARQPAGEPEACGMTAVWAQHLDEVRAAQRLRYSVFARELGARLETPANAAYPEHDIDMFDDFCEHLLVRHKASQQVVGTCRVLTPAQAKRIGGTCTDAAFDLTRLRGMRERMVELGRGCVHRAYRHGGVVMVLGGTLFEFMLRNRFEAMIGSAGILPRHDGEAGGNAAASLWSQVGKTHLAPIEHQVFPRRPLPLDRLDATRPVKLPALLKGYLRLGARVLGPPAWDPACNSADLPIMARLEDFPARYRRRFLGA